MSAPTFWIDACYRPRQRLLLASGLLLLALAGLAKAFMGRCYR